MDSPLLFIFFFIFFSIFIKKKFKIQNILKNFIINFFFSLIFFSFFNYESNNYSLNLYFILSVNLLFLWFYYTFVEGFSSKLIILIFKLKQKNKIKKYFLNKKNENIIIIKRLNYLQNKKYIKKNKLNFYLTTKAKFIGTIHNLISTFLNIKKSGGIDN